MDGPCNRRQVTFREESQYLPELSPDGKQIAFIGGLPPGYIKVPSHLYTMDRDGGNKKQLSFGDEIVSAPQWSPDGRRIAYGSRKLEESTDSFRTYIIEPSSSVPPKYVMRGVPNGGWIDSVRFSVQLNRTTYITSINGEQPREVYDDSTAAFLVQGGKYILYHDLHAGKDIGVWITDGNKPREIQRKTACLLPWTSHNIKTSGDGKFNFSIRGKNALWKIAIPDGKEERLRADFLGVEYFDDFASSWNGKEVIITKWRRSTSIVIIEDIFK